MLLLTTPERPPRDIFKSNVSQLTVWDWWGDSPAGEVVGTVGQWRVEPGFKCRKEESVSNKEFLG